MAKYWDDLAIAKSLMDLSAEGERLKGKRNSPETQPNDKKPDPNKAIRTHEILSELHWSLDHIAFANMGGFALEYTPEPDTAPNIDSPGATSGESGSSSTGNPLGSIVKSCLSAFKDILSWLKPKEVSWDYLPSKYDRDHKLWYLNADDIIKLCDLKGVGAKKDRGEQHDEKDEEKKGEERKDEQTTQQRNLETIMHKLQIEPAEIADRSKSDILMRVIAVGQIIWVIIQVIARAVRHLAVTQLEVAVVAFALCAIMMYWLNRHKPKGVSLPVLIPCDSPDPDIKEILKKELSETSPTPQQNPPQIPRRDGLPWSARFRRIFLQFFGQDGRIRSKPIRNGFTISDADAGRSDFRSQFADVSLIVGGVVFGGVHLVAWRFAFPTHIEQILWWAAAAWCAFFFPFVAVQFFYVDTIHRRLFAPVLRILFRVLDKLGLEDLPLAFVPKTLREKKELELRPRYFRKKNPPRDAETGTPEGSDAADSKRVEAGVQNLVPESSKHDISAASPETANQASSQDTKKDWKGEIDLLIEWFFFCWTMFLLAVYVVARLFIIVEMFRALAYLPPDAYYGTWGSNLPGF
ncbi:hypothetical protein BO94DRAFT_533749, partial [Aspergillus sclerotioniger CBS 115572]